MTAPVIGAACALAWAGAGIAALLDLPFALEILAGVRRPPDAGAPDRVDGEILVIIPAHDEEKVIGRTLAALGPRSPNVRLLVVADNCSDRTAEIAAAAGASVIARHDETLRGKSYALAFAQQAALAAPPAAIVILDADCVAEPGAVERLAGAALARNRPVQGHNLLRAGSDDAVVQVSNFAFFIKNHLRQAGLSRLGGAVLLTGTGMAMPWPLFRDADLASGSLAEDLELGLELSLAGSAPFFLPAARVWSDAAGRSGTFSQRTRWERGFLATARHHALRLLGRGVASRSRRLVFLGIHLLVPPVVTLGLVNLVAIGAAAATMPLHRHAGPLILSASAMALYLGAIVTAWFAGGKEYLPPRALPGIARYVLWKLPLYARALTSRAPGWVRTDRS